MGHWALGFICGTIIILPFIKERYIYNYETHKWISVKWTQVHKRSKKWVRSRGKKKEELDILTNELHPITTSRFMFYHFLFANLCGFFALLPDIGQLWGDHHTDHQWWADIFFFHNIFDTIYLGTPNPISFSTFIAGAAIATWIIVITLAWYLQYDNKPLESVLV